MDDIVNFSSSGEFTFRKDHACLNLVAVGDVIPSGRLESRFASGDVDGIFGNTDSVFLCSDFVLYNLETPLCNTEEPIAKCGANFKAAPKIVNGLKRMNFTLAALANNHIMDYGESGLEQTLAALDQAGIMRHGAGKSFREAETPLDTEKNGLKLTFLNFAEGEFSKASVFNAGAARLDPIQNKKAIEDAKERSDIVIVSVHAGKEFQHFPSPRIQDLYRSFVDYGANVVIGHHPHIPQGFEYYNKCLIAYSLGDFLFEYDMDPGTCAVMALAIGINDDGVTAIKLHPIRKNTDASLMLLEGKEKQRFINHINRLNSPLKSPDEMMTLYEQGVLRHFDFFYIHNLVRHAKHINGSETNRKDAAKFIYNMVDCPAHREALKNGFKMMYTGQYEKDDKIQEYLGSLYHCLETLGRQASLEPWPPPKSFLEKVMGKLARMWR